MGRGTVGGAEIAHGNPVASLPRLNAPSKDSDLK